MFKNINMKKVEDKINLIITCCFCYSKDKILCVLDGSSERMRYFKKVSHLNSDEIFLMLISLYRQ